MRNRRESKFETRLIAKLEHMFPGCYVIKQDSSFRQGIPDRLVLWRNMWAALEVKASANAVEQPNQSYYIEEFDRMSFAAFIYPENEEEVLSDLQRAFGADGSTRVSQP